MKRQRGQALVEYILMVAMISVTAAITIRVASRAIYNMWTVLATKVSAPCSSCTMQNRPPVDP